MNAENRQRLEDLFKRTMKVDAVETTMGMGVMTQWDSLKHVELLTEIDEAFGIQVEPTDLWKMTTVKGIVDVLSKYVD